MTSKRWLPVPALSLLLATPAFAAEGGGGGLLDPSAGLIFWQIVVFVLVLAALMKFAYPHILGAVEAREARIRELLAAAARDREEAQTFLEEQRRQLDEVRTRAQELAAEGREAGERIREEMIEETRREQAEMLVRARREIRQEMERALEEIRGDAVELAIAAASRLVERDLDQEANRRFVREFLDRVEIEGREPIGAGA
jgi:F-type H+-transporting ATPase subunit b